MKWKWLGLVVVLLCSAVIVYYKARQSPAQPAVGEQEATPQVLMVADLREADAEGDACAEIIRMVRALKARGFHVQELEPDSKSELLTRHRILTVPTVLIFHKNGQTAARFEGEDRETIARLRAALQELRLD